MIKCTEFVLDTATNPPVGMASLVADTKEEVIAMGNVANNVYGLQNGTILTFGSTCFTVEQELIMLDSQNQWR